MEITFKDVSYTYQPNTPYETEALKQINFHISSGEFIAIVGATGSGKSTLLQHMNGLLQPTKGTVQIGEFQLPITSKKVSLKELRKKVGIVFQFPEHQLFEETVREDILFGPKNFGLLDKYDENHLKVLLQQIGLDEALLDRSPFELSGGQMRKVAIAGVLASKPEVLVLDEPTAGLDPISRHEVMELFAKLHRENQLTTILVTHQMEDALKYADYIIVLSKGQIHTQGKPEDIFNNPKDLEEVQLLLPESMDLIHQLRNAFGYPFSYQSQTPKDIANEIILGLGED